MALGRRILALSFLFLPGVARSAPVIDMSWNACSPIQHDRVLPAGETASDLYVIASGVDGTHTGYQFKMVLGTKPFCGALETPDAWRFDAAGCQGPSFFTGTSKSTSKTCPAFSGPNAPGVEIVDLSYNPFDTQTTVTVAVAYASQVADPNQTYQLAHLHFDHTYAVSGAGTPGQTCGGFEKPMCFALWGGFGPLGNCIDDPPTHARASYLDGGGVQHDFLLPSMVRNSFRVDSSIQACNLVTPARPATWGSIKAQYH